MNPIEELNQFYQEGYRILAVTLQWGIDGEKVLLKDEGYNGTLAMEPMKNTERL